MRAQKLTVYVFLATECPISQQMTLPLNEIITNFNEFDIKWINVFTDGKRYKKLIFDFTTTYDLKSWKIIHNKKLKLANKYHAKVTPEVVLVNYAGDIEYQGAVNNWYYEWGKRRSLITEDYLEKAIKSYFEKRSIEIKKTDAIGCWINF